MLRVAAQRELDSRLFRLLQSVRNKLNCHGELAKEAQNILEQYTHPPGNPVRGGEHLLSTSWQEDWANQQAINGLFLWDENVQRYPGDILATALEDVFKALIGLLLDADSAYFQKKHRQTLDTALADYLARRGYDTCEVVNTLAQQPETSSPQQASVSLDVPPETGSDSFDLKLLNEFDSGLIRLVDRLVGGTSFETCGQTAKQLIEKYSGFANGRNLFRDYWHEGWIKHKEVYVHVWEDQLRNLGMERLPAQCLMSVLGRLPPFVIDGHVLSEARSELLTAANDYLRARGHQTAIPTAVAMDCEQRRAKLVSLPDEALMNHVDLANTLGIDAEPLRKRLERWRRRNHDGWQEAINPKVNEPRYVYRISAIRFLLRAAIGDG